VPLCEAPPAPPGVSACWREETGDVLRTVIARARVHDLTVLGRTPEANPLSASGIGEILIASGRPVLLAPAKAPENLAPTVAIAWKETAEAARAMGAAMPILAKAEKIVVLSAAEGDDTADALNSAEAAARQLRWHNTQPEAYGVAPAGRAASDAILDMARASGADMLVMGGFGHTRLREFVFGGFTQQVLRECRLPVFLFH
jgi:nucleotide-binding universal stress UspA family protein